MREEKMKKWAEIGIKALNESDVKPTLKTVKLQYEKEKKDKRQNKAV